MTGALVVLALVTAQRLGELALARRNTRRLIARGGREVGAAHYPLMLALHTTWLIGLWLLGHGRAIVLFWLGVYLVLQSLRVWVLTTLGDRWTTRIIVLPGAPLVREGPYRLLSHPNYAVVTGEIVVLPLVFALPTYAAVFFVLNALVLWVRIRAENKGLRG